MTWKYQIVKYASDSFGLHEVYCDDTGKPYGMTKDATCFVGNSPDEVRESLNMALKDAVNEPVFEKPKAWNEQPPCPEHGGE